MSGRAHRQEIRGCSTTVAKQGIKPASQVQDGPKENFDAIQRAQEAKARNDNGNPADGESGSEILDYQRVPKKGQSHAL